MWRLDLERTPTPTTSLVPLLCCGPKFSGVLHPSPNHPPLNLFVISSQTLAVLASDTYDFLKPTLFVFPPSPHSYIPNFTRSLFLPFSIRTLYFHVVISTSLRYLPAFLCPQLCYFLLCMEDTFSLRSLGK